MPDFYPDRVAIRASGQSVRVYASVFVGAVVASGEVILDSSNDALALEINVTGGDIADARHGFEVVITNAAGQFKLRTHIPFANAISSIVLPIRELSYGTAQIIAGDLFSVYREVRLHDKLVAAVGTPPADAFAPDYLRYTDEGDKPSPVTCSGGAFATFVDGYLTQTVPETYATVPFPGSTSYTTAPASSGAGTHAWRFPAGSTPTTSTSANPSAQIPVGSWLIEHDFTDSTNGKTTTQYVPVIVHDAASQPYDIAIDSGLQADEQYNWRYTVRLFQDATLTDIPDGALVILWARERTHGAWASYRNAAPGRETILAVGYAHHDTPTGDAYLSKVTFDIVSPAQRLDEIAGYSKVMEEAATPDSWSKLLSLTVKRAIVQLLYYYTTLIESGFDVIFDAGFINPIYPALYLQRSTPIQQVRELCHGVDAVFMCDRTGRFNLYTYPPYLPLADRDALTVTFILGGEDIIDYSFDRSHYDTVELMKTAGFTADSSPQPVFSLYPGSAPGEAVNAPTYERLICDASDGQADLNERTGRYGALVDNVFIDADGYKQRAFPLKLTLFGSYDFADFCSEWFALSIDGTSNLRGIDLSSFRYYLKAVSVTYNGGTARTQITLQAETNAPVGTTYLPPQQIVQPIYTPPPLVLPPLTGLPASLNALVGVNTDGYWYYTYNLLSASPTWARTAIPGLSGAIIDSVQDAFTLTRQIIVTDDAAGIYTVENATGTGSSMATTLRKTLRGSISGTGQWRMVDASFGADFIVCVSFYGDLGGTRVCCSLDGGLSWGAETQITADYGELGGGGNVSGLFVSSRAPGVAYVGAYISTAGAASTADLFQLSAVFSASADTGVSSGNIVPSTITKSWADNENTLYFGGAVLSGPADARNRTYRKTGSGAVIDITPVVGGNNQRPDYSRGVHVCPVDANTLLIAAQGNGTSGVFMSRDKGDTQMQISSGTSTNYRGVEVAGNNADFGYAWGFSGAIGTVDLAAQTVTDRSGNLSTFSPGRFVRIRGV